jgi:formylglycine-generating enzyme required for sulfatase activity
MPPTSTDYADLEIRLDPHKDGYAVTMVLDGQESTGLLDSSILLRGWNPASPEADGEWLFSQLCSSPPLQQAWGRARARTRCRIRLSINQAAPELHQLPWELLRAQGAPLAAAGDTPFSRYLYGPWEPGQPIAAKPVKMLVAIANPNSLERLHLPAIDVETEWQAIRAAARRAGIEPVQFPQPGQPCTLHGLVDKLAEGFHILHLICHGTFLVPDNQAALYLADDSNQVRYVYEGEFAGALRNAFLAAPGQNPLRLIFLASCETATRSPADAFRGLAPQLVAAGVPVVLAMQDKVAVETARDFAGEFYEKLLQHGLVDLASNQARAKIVAKGLSGSWIPALFMRPRDGRLLEVRSHEERAYLAGIMRRSRGYAEKYTAMPGKVTVAKEGASDQPPSPPPRPEFVELRKKGGGQQAEVERVPVPDLRQAIREHRRMVVLGEPGSGKTTTLWDLAYHYAQEAQENAQAPLPVFVSLDGYTGPEQALDFVKAQVGDLKPQLTALLQDGRVVLLLDALNQMPPGDYRPRVRRIQALLSEFEMVPVVVTCRELDYVEELNLHRLEIQPLEPVRQRQFVENYLGLEQGEALFWQMAGPEVADAWRAWHGLGGRWEDFWSAQTMPDGFEWRYTQQRTWQRLRAGQLPPLLALGRNPYMLYMMVSLYHEEQGKLPRNRGDLFDRFVRTLLRREEGSPESSPWPGAEALQRSLSRLAYAMQSASEGGTAVDPKWAKEHMAADNVDPGWLFRLARRASLLELDGGSVRFVHQLVQEYFAAVALGERLAAGEDLRRYWPNGWVEPSGWEETTVLLAGLLDDMNPLVKQLLVANPPLAARCIAESGGERPAVATVQSVQQRLVDLMTDPRVAIPQRNAAGVAINHVGDPRRGVGLRGDGLSDIEWVFVPEKDPKSGRKEFIYGERKELRSEADFWIARYPITYRQFQAFLDAPDGFRIPRWWEGLSASAEHRSDAGEQWFKHWNHPRERVSWWDAMAFCAWLTAKADERPDLLPDHARCTTGWQITLPTEQQWEKAARGHDGRQYPWGGSDYKSGYANIDETYTKVGPHYLQKTSAVGMYPQGVSPYGVADLSGNVWEWCLNEYESGKTHPGGNATRVLRGGSWSYGPHVAAAPFRSVGNLPLSRVSSCGFRVVVVGCVPVP